MPRNKKLKSNIEEKRAANEKIKIPFPESKTKTKKRTTKEKDIVIYGNDFYKVHWPSNRSTE